MTQAIWVNNPNLAQKLQARFNLQVYPADLYNNLLLVRSIQPVINADDLRKEPGYKSTALNLNVAAGSFVELDEVPTGKKRIVTLIFLDGTSAGTCPMLTDPSAPGAPFQLGTLNSTGFNWQQGLRIELLEGWKIGAYATNNAGDGSRLMVYFYEEYDLQ